MGVFDVPANELIEEIARDLEKKFKLEIPAFTQFAKTGAHRERAPQREDWYYVRTASILYRVFKEGPLGVGSLRAYYGGKRNRGVRPHQFRKASGKIIRTGLQDLEKAGLIKKAGKGRVISPSGQSYLLQKSKEVKALLSAKRAESARKKAEEKERREKERLEELRKEAAKQKEEPGKGKKRKREKEPKKE